MTLNPSPPPKKAVLMFFLPFQAVTHIFRTSCAEMAGDRPGQPAYKIFSTKRRFTAASFDPLGSRRPAQANVKE